MASCKQCPHSMYLFLYSHQHPAWKKVAAEERKDVFEDVIFSLAAKEKEQEKRQRERNTLYLAKIFKRMESITYRTSWAEAFDLLSENRTFKKDDELQSKWGGREVRGERREGGEHGGREGGREGAWREGGREGSMEGGREGGEHGGSQGGEHIKHTGITSITSSQ